MLLTVGERPTCPLVPFRSIFGHGTSEGCETTCMTIVIFVACRERLPCGMPAVSPRDCLPEEEAAPKTSAKLASVAPMDLSLSLSLSFLRDPWFFQGTGRQTIVRDHLMRAGSCFQVRSRQHLYAARRSRQRRARRSLGSWALFGHRSQVTFSWFGSGWWFGNLNPLLCRVNATPRLTSKPPIQTTNYATWGWQKGHLA